MRLLEDESRAETAKANSLWYDPRLDLNLVRKPERFIYVYSISKKGFTIERPPLFPCVRVPACSASERFKMVAKIPDPFVQAIQNTENGRLRGEAHDGLRVAIDLINPNNLSSDPDWVCPDHLQGLVATGYGCDLSKQGLFVSLTPEPTEDELKKAEAKRHKYYDGLRREIELTPEREVVAKVYMNDDFGMMADYFGIEYTWHKKQTAFASCPNCDARIPMGVAFHQMGNVICVLDWKRAVDAGVKSKADVPDEKKWWGKEKA